MIFFILIPKYYTLSKKIKKNILPIDFYQKVPIYKVVFNNFEWKDWLFTKLLGLEASIYCTLLSTLEQTESYVRESRTHRVSLQHVAQLLYSVEVWCKQLTGKVSIICQCHEDYPTPTHSDSNKRLLWMFMVLPPCNLKWTSQACIIIAEWTYTTLQCSLWTLSKTHK